MTGFGSAQVKKGGFVVGVDLRTVNHRYFRIQSKAPDELAPFCGEAEAEIRKVIRRGSVTFTARLELLPEGAENLVDEKVLASYLKLCRRLGRKYDLEGKVSLSELFSLPGVISGPEAGSVRSRSELETAFRRALTKALEALSAMREREGRALKKELLRRAERAARLLGPIERTLPGALRKLQDELLARIEVRVAEHGLRLDRNDLAREIALIAERTDVTEELERLKSHIAQARDLLEQGGEIGRRLDFLAQELLREVSTMSAKVGSSALADNVLNLKVEIDRLKEQAQNIE